VQLPFLIWANYILRDKQIHRDLLKLMCSCPSLYGKIILYVISKFTGIC